MDYDKIKEEAGSHIALLINSAIEASESSAARIAEEMISSGLKDKPQTALALHISNMRNGMPYGVTSELSAVNDTASGLCNWRSS